VRRRLIRTQHQEQIRSLNRQLGAGAVVKRRVTGPNSTPTSGAEQLVTIESPDGTK